MSLKPLNPGIICAKSKHNYCIDLLLFHFFLPKEGNDILTQRGHLHMNQGHRCFLNKPPDFLYYHY